MPSSMEERPASARSAQSLFTTLPSTTMTSSNYGAGSRASASRERAASSRGERQRPSTAPTLSASSHASRIIRMLVGERRSAAEHEHLSAAHATGDTRFPGDATRSSAELGRRTRPKSSKPLKTLFGASPNKNAPTRKSRRTTIPRPRLTLFSGARKSSSTTSHPQPAPAHPQSLIQPRVPGVFVPSLPEELWLLIFRYAAYPPFVDLPAPVSSLHPTYARAYPYPTTYDPHSEAVSFLHHPMAHAHLGERRAAYRAQMRAKAVLRYVCRAWSTVAEEVLWEFVWVASAKEGRRVAGMLGGDVGGVWVGASVCIGGGGKEKESRKEKEGKGKGKKPAVDAASVVSRRSSSFALAPPSVGRWIKRLHVETRALERCSPHDLLLILQNCPNLIQYSDHKSVRRPMHPLMLSLSDVAPFNVASDGASSPSAAVVRHQHQQQAPLLTPDALLSNLLERPLRRLTWTNYDYDASDFEAGVRFYQDVVAPRLEAMGGKLEYLELVLSGTATHGMGQRAANAWGVGGACEVGRRGGMAPVLSRNPAQAMYGAANMLTELEAAYTSTSTTVHAPALAALPTTLGGEDVIASVDGWTFALRLPALKTLKVTLDNATFLVLSTWDMPQLTHLSIVSADFGYAAPGFRRFFEVHGTKLTQLELGHSSGAIEEAWVTDPAPAPATAAQQPDAHDITLEAWCPHLTEFICSADAEWNWQRPDWIAPHVLLPAHAGVQFIGVRDMEKRLLSDLDEALRRRRGDGLRSARDVEDVEGWEHWGDDDEEEEEDGGEYREDDPYFALLQQFGSLLRSEAFPALRYVRDMSWESDVMRRTCTMRPLPPSAAVSAADRAPTPQPQPLDQARHTAFGAHQHWWSTAAWAQTAAGGKAAREGQARRAAREAEEALARAYGRRLNVFWRRVVRMCRRRGVWLEDCFGVNVTKANLKQAVGGI